MKEGPGFAIATAFLLMLMAILAGGAALRESATVDEVAHIGAGVSYLQKLDLRMNPEHPPLAKALAAVPLVLWGTRADYSSVQWTASRAPFAAFLGEWVFGDWLLARWNDPVSTLAWARLPMLLLTLALGWVVLVLGWRLGGKWGGLLSLSLYVSTPAFLAFGPLVHTDLAISLFSLLTIWTFADVYDQPSRKRVWVFAACLAGAMLSKFTAGLLLFVLPVFAWSTRWRPVAGQPTGSEEARAWRRRRWRAVCRGVLLAGAMVYVFYLVFSWNQPTYVLDYIPGGAVMVPIRRLLMPAWEYVFGLLLVLMMSSRPTFVLGHFYPHGVWFYYPVLLVLKSPMGFLVLLVVTVVGWVLAARKGKETPGAVPVPQALHRRALWVALVVLTSACLLSRLNLSIRHFSVPLVLMIVLVSRLPRRLERLRVAMPRTARALQAATATSAVSCLVAVVLAYPNYFPYMNVLSHGRPAYTLVNDSNVDWNQSLPEVGRFAERRGLKMVPVDAYGMTDPSHSVPRTRLWDCQKPEERDAGQWVVVSANMILDGHNCVWLRGLPQEELAGGSLYAFLLPAVISPAGSPGGPPLPSQFRQFAAIPAESDVRAMFVEMSEHPEEIPAKIAEYEAKRKQEQKPKRASGKGN